MANPIYTIAQLNQLIKQTLDGAELFQNVVVSGEISNYKAHSSGHHYLTLKDAEASIPAVLFRMDAMRLKFRLENGMKILAKGRVSTFPKTGQVQLYLTDIMPDGVGALHLAFEQLKHKLQQEGLFDTSHKKELPAIPTRIALITAPTGAAVHDMLRILKQRWPLASITIVPSLVQGVDAPQSLQKALKLAHTLPFDCIIIGRGGGSMEDLWAFNDEALAYAIYQSSIPIVSAVGHEPDFTICDFVADVRAPTPSGAAQICVPNQTDLRELIASYQVRIHQSFLKLHKIKQKSLEEFKHRLSRCSPVHKIVDDRMRILYEMERLALRSPLQHIQTYRTTISALQEKSQKAMKMHLQQYKASVFDTCSTLDALSPLKVLNRGYALVRHSDGSIISNTKQVHIRDTLKIQLNKGILYCEVLQKE